MNEAWKPDNNRFVAFIDILGFKDYVIKNDHITVNQLLKDINSILKTKINSDPFNGQNVDNDAKNPLFFTTFSDSIVIFTKDDNFHTFHYFGLVLVSFLKEVFKRKIPLKGAIAHGLITVNKLNNLFHGQPLINAYLLEEELQYMGIVCHHSIDKYLESRPGHHDAYLINIKTPLKGGKFIHRNIIHAKNDSIFKEIHTFRSKSSGIVRKYIDNTEDVFRNIIELEKHK